MISYQYFLGAYYNGSLFISKLSVFFLHYLYIYIISMPKVCWVNRALALYSIIYCVCSMQLAESAKAQFAAREYSDHLALVRAYEGWKDAETQQAGYEYCWRNFLSSQTLKAIESLRKQFFYLLKDIGLVNDKPETYNAWSHEVHLIRAVICAGLFPGISSVMVTNTASPFNYFVSEMFSFHFYLFTFGYVWPYIYCYVCGTLFVLFVASTLK